MENDKMSQENTESLKKIGKIFNTDKIITSDEINQVLEGIVAILATYKRTTQEINDDTKAVVNQLLDKVQESKAAVETEISAKKDSTVAEFDTKKDGVIAEFNKKIAEVKSLLETVRAIKIEAPEPAKEVDTNEIVQAVLKELKLPEYKAFELHGEDVVASINALDLDDDENKIDWKHIKNVPKNFGVGQNQWVGSPIRYFSQMEDFDTTTAPTNGQVPVWNSTTKKWTPGTVSGGGGGTPPGSDTQVIFNDAGAYGADPGFTFDITNTQLTVGLGSTAVGLPEIAFAASGNIASYFGYFAQNLNPGGIGVNASTDIILANDIDDGTIATGHYIDMGINSSAYGDLSIFPALSGVNNGYLYVVNGSLAIGTASTGKNIDFFTGGLAYSNRRMRITSGGSVGFGTVAPNNFFSIAPVRYSTGTASQSGTTVTGVGTTFTAAMVGSLFEFDDGTSAGTITAFGSATSLTVSISQTVSSQTYSIHYNGIEVSNTGLVGIGTINPTASLDILDTTIAGSGSLAGSILNLTQTWNTSGTPTAIKLNITDTASNAASLLQDLRVGGVSQFSVSKAGAVVTNNGSINTGSGAITTTGNVSGNNGLFSSLVRAGATSAFALNGRSQMKSPSDGMIYLRNNADSAYSDLTIKDGTAQSLTLADTTLAGSGSLAGSVFSATQTWNTSGAPTAWKLNITNTASGAASLFLDFQIAGTSFFKVAKDGSVTTNNGALNLGTGAMTTSGNVSGNNGLFSTLVRAGATSAFMISTRSQIKSSADGLLELMNTAGTDFTRLNFGGTTSSFPGIKRSTTAIHFVLADDSAFTGTQDLYNRFGSGTPEAAVTAPVGAIFHRTDGGASTSIYVKESGSGNTGWVAK